MSCQYCNINQMAKNKIYCQHCINNMCIECKRILSDGEKRHKIFTITETNKFHCAPCYNEIWNYMLREKIIGYT